MTSQFSVDGFLVLGHDVDRYSADDTIPIWDKYGFEKMQSFSGAMSQLNFWRQWIPDTQIKDMAFCKGTFVSNKIAFWRHEKVRYTFVNVTELITIRLNECVRFPSYPKLTGRKLRKWPRSYKCSCLFTLLVIWCDFFVGIFSWVHRKEKQNQSSSI